MSILVTGGSGFLGRRIVRQLAGQGQEAVCFDRDAPPASKASQANDGTFFLGDVLQVDVLREVIRQHRVQRIIHLAAILPPESEKRPEAATRINVLGTRNVFEAAASAGVERVVYASSIAVYGPQTAFGESPVSEDDALFPETCYGLAKAASEGAAAFYRRRGLDVRVLRVSSVFGHGRHKGVSGSIGGALISHPAVGKPANIEVSGQQASSMIYVDDAAQLCIRMALSEGLAHHTYLSGGISATAQELAAIVRDLIPDARIKFGDKRLSHVHLVDGSRLLSDTGCRLPSLRERIRDQIEEARSEAGIPLGTRDAASCRSGGRPAKRQVSDVGGDRCR